MRENKLANPPSIKLSEPYPLLDPGRYVACCTRATYEWARQWKKWMAILVLEPQNYKDVAIQDGFASSSA